MRRMTVALLAAATTFLLIGCTSLAPKAAAKNGDGTIHHELASLTSRVPAVSDATEGSWTGGTFGDGRVPGPSTYWIDAVVELPKDTADQLRTATDLTAADAPAVADAIKGLVPQTQYLQGPSLNQRYAAADWNTEAYLAKDGTTLVLTLIGGN